MTMRYPQQIGRDDPFDFNWFNDVTMVLQRLESEIMALKAEIQAMSLKCECGNTALPGDYLCGHCRDDFICRTQKTE